jgi:hypothetical protein
MAVDKITLKPCLPEHKGTKSYRLTETHYRDGRLYSAGEMITVTDEKPGTTWEPLDAKEVEAAIAAKPKAKPTQAPAHAPTHTGHSPKG